MSNSSSNSYNNIYHNVVTGATPNALISNPDAIDEVFATAANAVLERAVEVARCLVGAHQGAIAIIVNGDWSSVRKCFSLSSKYAEWANYQTSAVGYGIHGWLLKANAPIRLTQAELEAHSEWKNFGLENGKHPPMRGWLAVPLVDSTGKNWGLFQLSDKYEGDFTEEDEKHFVSLVALVSSNLEALWTVRNLQKQQAQ